MKTILFIMACLVSITASAGNSSFVVRLECEATNFRAGTTGDQVGTVDSGRLYLNMRTNDDDYYLKEYFGHVYVGDYYGTFAGDNLNEVPYKKAVVYKNHFRFKNLDAVKSGGSEGGMWGYLALNKNVENLRVGESTDAHYVFQAGDHQGGTVDFKCTKDL